MFIDIHRHSAYHGNADIVLRNIFHFATHQVEDQPYCSVGLHPWHLKENSVDEDIEKVKEVAGNRKVIAIGETGLDKSKETPLDLQKKVFKEHVQLAKDLSKPMVIHCVRGYSEMLQLRKELQHEKAWIFHWFNSNEQTGMDLIEKGCYLSFGHMLFNETSKAYKAFPHIPLDNIFLETDDADFSIHDIYEKAAELRNIALKDLKQQIKLNFEKVFDIAL